MLEHKHLIIRAEIENPPKDQAAVEKWIAELSEGELCVETTEEGIVCVAVNAKGMVAARFWNSDPALLQMDVCASDIDPTDIFDAIESFVVLTRSTLFLDRTNAIQQIF